MSNLRKETPPFRPSRISSYLLVTSILEIRCLISAESPSGHRPSRSARLVKSSPIHGRICFYPAGMKLAVLVASTIVGFVAGQASVGQLPTCAIPCVNGGIEATGCSLADVSPPPFSVQCLPGLPQNLLAPS